MRESQTQIMTSLGLESARIIRKENTMKAKVLGVDGKTLEEKLNSWLPRGFIFMPWLL